MKFKSKWLTVTLTVLLVMTLLFDFSKNSEAISTKEKNLKTENTDKLLNEEKNVVVIETNEKLRKIKKEIFGVHIPAWNETVFDRGLLNERLKKNLKETGIGFLVYPGGNYGANFKWNALNLPTEMNTDQFLHLKKELDATAKISVNPNESPQLAADWVRYVNKQKKANVKYWEIADEPYFTMSADKFVEKVKTFAPVMKSVDPSIKIIANVSVYNPDFTKKVIKEAGDYIDVYSIHSLPLPPSKKFSPNSPYSKENQDVFFRDLLQTPDQLRNELATVKSWVKELGGKKEVEYHIGSFNTVWWAPEDWTVNSLPVGLWMADMLGTFIEEDIDAAAYWALMNPFPPGKGDFGLFSPEMKPYVNFYPFELYKNHFGKILVKSHSNVKDVSTYASVSNDGKNLYVMLINKSPNEDKTIEFDLGTFKPRGDAAAWILDGPTVADHLYDYGLRKESLNNVTEKFSWTVPSYAVVALEIPGKSSKLSIQETPNLAKDKRATASSSAFNTDYDYAKTNDFIPDKAIDGDPMTRWASKVFKRESETFQVDLGQVQKFNSIKLNWEYWATKYTIEASEDGETWTKIADQSNAEKLKEPPQPIEQINFASPVNARYVRISMTERPKESGIKAGTSQWTPDAFSLWEIEVYLKSRVLIIQN
jgi:alpha-L-arabinofuranosidase